MSPWRWSTALLLVTLLALSGCVTSQPGTQPPAAGGSSAPAASDSGSRTQASGGPAAAGTPAADVTPAAASLPASLTFGTASTGSTFYTIAVGMGDLINKNTPMKVSVQSVGGADPSVRAIGEGRADIAIANAYSSVNGYLGLPPYQQRLTNIRLIAQGQLSLRNVIVRADSGIRSFKDMEGKKIIARRKAVADLELTADALFKAYGVDKSKVQILETAEANEAIEAVKIGAAHGLILPGGIRAGTVMELAESTDVIFMGVADDKQGAVLGELGPAFVPGRIPANTYRGQSTDEVMPAILSVLIVRADLSDDAVYAITKAIMGNYDELSKVHAVAKEWTVENALSSAPVPFHPGAIRYYQETGAWNDPIEKAQQAALQK